LRACAKAIPGLWGYVGVDFTESGPVVLGVYPRLTASYFGLHVSICNPVGLVLDLLKGDISPTPPPYGKAVVSVDAQAFGV
jgi:predicted ATP-grasp superfamily ATP-dependent carboligase